MAEMKPITTLEEFEAEYGKGIGTVLPPTPWKEANLDSILMFEDGIGDYNPLRRDEEHAKKSRFGMITAPPSFLYRVCNGWNVSIIGNIDPRRLSLKNVTLMYAGCDWEFFRPIWLGDKLYGQEKIVDIYRKRSKALESICFCAEETSYYNQHQELVATNRTLMARFQNPGRGVEADRENRTGVALEGPDGLVYEAVRRGTEPRYWEDVKEGEEIPLLKKGTYTPTEIMYFHLCCVGSQRTPRAALEEGETIDMGGGGRMDPDFAQRRRAMPAQFDWGPQRICWLIQMMTDWMGDDGTLKKISSSVRRPNLVGDTNTVKGKVWKKYTEGGEHLVDCDIWVENQTGATTAPARATVVLPSKG